MLCVAQQGGASGAEGGGVSPIFTFKVRYLAKVGAIQMQTGQQRSSSRSERKKYLLECNLLKAKVEESNPTLLTSRVSARTGWYLGLAQMHQSMELAHTHQSMEQGMVLCTGGNFQKPDHMGWVPVQELAQVHMGVDQQSGGFSSTSGR